MALFVKILLLSFMAAIFFLASNMQAFFFMNQFVLFRNVRNYTAFFFLFVGHLAASLFAWMSGQEKKPTTDQIHQATVFIMEAVTLGLLLSIFITLYRLVIDYMNDRARKELEDAKRRLDEEVTREFNRTKELLPGFAGRFHAEFPPPLQPVLPEHPTAADIQDLDSRRERYDEEQKNYAQKLEEALQKAEKRANDVRVHFDAVFKRVKATRDWLGKKYSIFSTMPDLRLMESVDSKIETTSNAVDQHIIGIRTYCQTIQQLKRDSNESKQRLDQFFAGLARERPSAALLTAQNSLPKAVLICVVLTTLFMAYKNSQASPPPRQHASASTQLALLENYFHTSEFSNYVQIVVLEIVGVYPAPPHHSKFIASCFCSNLRSYFLHFRHLAPTPTSHPPNPRQMALVPL